MDTGSTTTNSFTTSTTPEAQAQQAIERKQAETKIVKISRYLDSDIVRARFAATIGDRNAGSYINSVMIAVKESPALQECSMDSIYISALRAATLKLSVDQSTGQAYMVPFKGHATLVVGYKGLYDMAVRTGKYRYINVGPIYDGQIVEENPITGFHSISGARTGDKVIGWIGAFEMNPAKGQVTGFGKTMYMTVEEIHEHAKQYSKGYENPKGTWKTETRKMERKTVLRLLIRRWGYLDPSDVQALNEAEEASDEVDATIYDVPQVPEYDEAAEQAHAETRTKEQNLKELGY